MLLVFLLLLSLLVCTDGSKNDELSYTVKTVKLECIINPLFSTNYTCKLKPINWEKSTINIMIYLIRPISKAFLRLELFTYTNQFRPFFLNVTTDVCKFLKFKQEQNIYVRMIFNLLPRFTNANHTCPYTDLVKIEGLYFEPKIVQFVMPPGKFMFLLTWFETRSTVMAKFKVIVVVNEKRNGVPKGIENHKP